MAKYNNSKIRKNVYLRLIKERGRKCQVTGAIANKSGKLYKNMNINELVYNLVMHEIDGNKKNLEPSNLLLINKGANMDLRIKEGRFRFNRLKLKGIPLDQYKYVKEEKLSLVNESMKRNYEGMKALRNWLNDKLEEKPLMELEYFKRNATSIGGVLADTIEKWIVPLTAEVDDYEIKEINKVDYIKLRDKHEQELENKYVND